MRRSGGIEPGVAQCLVTERILLFQREFDGVDAEPFRRGEGDGLHGGSGDLEFAALFQQKPVVRVEQAEGGGDAPGRGAGIAQLEADLLLFARQDQMQFVTGLHRRFQRSGKRVNHEFPQNDGGILLWRPGVADDALEPQRKGRRMELPLNGFRELLVIQRKAERLPASLRPGERGVERGVSAVPVGDGDGGAARGGTCRAVKFQGEFRAVEFQEFQFLQQPEGDPGRGGILPAKGEARAAVEGTALCRHRFRAEPGIDF